MKTIAEVSRTDEDYEFLTIFLIEWIENCAIIFIVQASIRYIERNLNISGKTHRTEKKREQKKVKSALVQLPDQWSLYFRCQFNGNCMRCAQTHTFEYINFNTIFPFFSISFNNGHRYWGKNFLKINYAFTTKTVTKSFENALIILPNWEKHTGIIFNMHPKIL